MTAPAIVETCAHCLGPLRGYAALGHVLLCHPDTGMDCYRLVTLYGHGVDCRSCAYQRATADSGPGRVHPVGERGAGEHDPGRDTPTCGRCRQLFDPTDTGFDGRAQYRDSAFCKWCINRCHEATEFDHECAVCAPGGAP